MIKSTIFYFDFIENVDGKETATEYDITEEQIRMDRTLISKKIFDKGHLVEERIYDGEEHIKTISYYTDGMLTRRESYDTTGDTIVCTHTVEYVNGRLQKKDCIIH